MDEIIYPDSDGEPLGETEPHIRVTSDLFRELDERYAAQPDVFVICGMFLYYEEGNPMAHKTPDIMVVKGVDTSKYRRSFKIWEGGTVPRVVFEMTSEKTQREDEEVKPALYARLGIAEYFLFDPLDDYLKPRFQGFRLVDGDYVPLVPDADGGLISEELGLRMIPDDIYLRLYDLTTNEPILSPTMRQLQEAEQRAQEEKRKAKAEKRKAEAEKRKAEEQMNRAEEEKRRAEELQRRAKEADAEIARLRKQLEELQQQKPNS